MSAESTCSRRCETRWNRCGSGEPKTRYAARLGHFFVTGTDPAAVDIHADLPLSRVDITVILAGILR